MFRPVGSQPPSVYWRRRLLILASAVLLVVLVVLTARAALSDDSAGSPTSSGPKPPPTSGTHPSTTGPSTTASTKRISTSSNTPTTRTTSTGAPVKCAAKQLAVRAVVGKPTYKVGDQPVLTLQVTNTGARPCVQDVADKQIVLRVYNGASRVWGSHDCQIEPGVNKRTLPVGKAIGFSLVWSGLTAQPGCAGTRQRVGAGTYTLYAALAGKDGTAAQFVIS